MGQSRPHIAVVVPALQDGGGVPSVAEFVCQSIERSGAYEHTLVSLSQSARDEVGVQIGNPATWLRGVLTDRSTWRGRPFTRVGAFASELEFQRYQPRKALAAVLAECDLIQVVSGSPAWAWAVCGLGKPVALQCATRAIIERRRRDLVSHGLKTLWRRWMTRLTDRLERKVLRTVDAVQVESPWMLEYAQGLNVGRDALIRYAPPGVDATRFQPRLRELKANPYILCVGRLDDPRKNIGLLLEAYAKLPMEMRATVRLVLAGAAGPDAPFWARASELCLSNRVDFVPKPDDDALIRLYQGATVFALPSDEEGLGVVILEAMACGVPIVSTRSGGPDGIITDGVDGTLVPLDDADAMAGKLAQLLADVPMNMRMGEAARQTILRKYEAGVAGKAFLDHYDALLKMRARRCAG